MGWSTPSSDLLNYISMEAKFIGYYDDLGKHDILKDINQQYDKLLKRNNSSE